VRSQNFALTRGDTCQKPDFSGTCSLSQTRTACLSLVCPCVVNKLLELTHAPAEVLAAFAVSKHQAPVAALAGNGAIDNSAAIRTNGTLSSQEEITSETASSSHEEFGPTAELTADELNPVTTVDPEHHETHAVLANTNVATVTVPKFGVHPVLDKYRMRLRGLLSVLTVRAR
jgi:hypothetical protein